MHNGGAELREALAGLDAARCLAFRQAPALQVELSGLVQACTNTNVIYDAPAQAIRGRAELLVEVGGWP